MSDFVSRLAARAVGERPLAEPRGPALPPGPLPADDDTSLDVVDEEVLAPRAPRPGPSPPPRAAATDAPAVSSGRPAERTPSADAVPAAPRQPPLRARERDPLPPVPPARPEAPPVPREERAAPRQPAGAPDARPPRAAAAAVAVPATRSLPGRTAATVAAPAAAASGHDEPAPVRVHIGRLEVRASLAEPPRPVPRPERREPDGLSLADYLRGKREAV